MNSPLLVRHPAPYATESLIGYVLRLSELNGYMSLWGLYDLAGLRQNEVRTVGFRFDRLAAVANRQPSELEGIAFSAPADKPRWARLLNHELVPTEMNVNSAAFCPKCVSEKGFIEAQWHLILMTGCPVHRCQAPTVCPKCGKRIRVFRHGLLECSCGGNLADCAVTPVDSLEASVLDIIRCKVLRTAPDCDDNTLNLPREQMLSMNLRSLLLVLRSLARYRLLADGIDGSKDRRQIILAAASVLTDWPKNFVTLLMDLGKARTFSAGGIRKQFESIYHALFKNRAIIPREQTDFLRVAFLEFANNHWDRGYIDSKLMRRIRDNIADRFVSKSEFAARFRMHDKTASRLLSERAIEARMVRCGSVERYLVDLEQDDIPRNTPGKTYMERDAAKVLGLSVGVLRALKDWGIYEVNNRLMSKGGYHEFDMFSFKERLLAVAPPPSDARAAETRLISLGEALNNRHDSPSTKVELVRAILSRNLRIRANLTGTIGGLLLHRSEYRAFIKAARKRSAGNTMLPKEVESELHCDAETVPGLVRKGLLEGERTPTGLRVTSESVERFKAKYVSLAYLAKTLGTTSRWGLMPCCRESGIPLILIPRRNQCQPFIRASDRERLISAFTPR